MFSLVNLKNQLLVNESFNFDLVALELFKFQSEHNLIYKQFLAHLNFNGDKVSTVEQIPFLPIQFFKQHSVTSVNAPFQKVFMSSGTGSSVRSHHYVKDADFYAQISRNLFELLYGSLSNYIVMALLPSYQENPSSSLIFMINDFIKASNHESSGFFSIHEGNLIVDIIKNSGNKKVLVIGVSYALLEMQWDKNMHSDNIIIMETGGMKGRGKELSRKELHQILTDKFNVDRVHSEYGMTELLSQSYALQDGVFNIPYTMKVFIREINDPRTINNQLHSGGLNIVDLANLESCAFIETQDLGRKTSETTFELLGRIDNSDIRGCNQLSFI